MRGPCARSCPQRAPPSPAGPFDVRGGARSACGGDAGDRSGDGGAARGGHTLTPRVPLQNLQRIQLLMDEENGEPCECGAVLCPSAAGLTARCWRAERQRLLPIIEVDSDSAKGNNRMCSCGDDGSACTLM
jgi:hypothetical protein